MLDEKIKLEDYFEEEIKRVSDIEIRQIEKDIDEIKERAIEDMEMEAQREAGIEREALLKEIMSDHAIALSKTHEETSRKLMSRRKELSNLVFAQAIERLKHFRDSADYKDYLIKKVKALTEKDFGHVVFYVSKHDESLLDELCKAYGDCEGRVDSDITIGGLRMECEEKGIVIDETFDTGIDEQNEWFYTNSGLFIK